MFIVRRSGSVCKRSGPPAWRRGRNRGGDSGTRSSIIRPIGGRGRSYSRRPGHTETTAGSVGRRLGVRGRLRVGRVESSPRESRPGPGECSTADSRVFSESEVTPTPSVARRLRRQPSAARRATIQRRSTLDTPVSHVECIINPLSPSPSQRDVRRLAIRRRAAEESIPVAIDALSNGLHVVRNIILSHSRLLCPAPPCV